MALKQEAAQLKCEASKKRVRDAVQSSSSSLVAAKQQKFWLPPPPMKSSSNAVVKHNPKYAKVNMMNAAQAEDSSEVIMGNLPVNDIPAKVLFDTGASHCFISRPFASKHELCYQVLPSSLSVVSPGKQMTSNICVPDVSIKMGDYRFLAKPIVLGDSDIDL